LKQVTTRLNKELQNGTKVQQFSGVPLGAQLHVLLICWFAGLLVYFLYKGRVAKLALAWPSKISLHIVTYKVKVFIEHHNHH
jgi:hypothetical protein